MLKALGDEPLVFYRVRDASESRDHHPVLQIQRCTVDKRGIRIEDIEKPDVKIMILSKLNEFMIDSALSGNMVA